MPEVYTRAGLSMLTLLSTVAMATAEPITFTDMAGRDITLEGVPKRVVSIASPAGSMVVTMAQDGETLVGTSPNSHRAMVEGVMDEFFPGLANIKSNFIPKEGPVNIEAILQLEPDVVLQWARNDKSIAALEAAGLKTVGMKYATLDIATNWLTDLGIMFE